MEKQDMEKGQEPPPYSAAVGASTSEAAPASPTASLEKQSILLLVGIEYTIRQAVPGHAEKLLWTTAVDSKTPKMQLCALECSLTSQQHLLQSLLRTAKAQIKIDTRDPVRWKKVLATDVFSAGQYSYSLAIEWQGAGKTFIRNDPDNMAFDWRKQIEMIEQRGFRDHLRYHLYCTVLPPKKDEAMSRTSTDASSEKSKN
jgi:hypothetical protein